MRKIAVIFRREVSATLASPTTHIAGVVFVGLSGFFFTLYLSVTNYSDTSLKGFASAGPFIIVLFSVFLSMRLIAEERKQGTWEIMLTAPVTDVELILGKYLGSLLILAGVLSLTVIYPLLLAVFGDPDWGPIGTTYIGLVVLGMASLAVGTFASSWSSNQFLAAAISGGVIFALWYAGMAGDALGGGLGEMLSYLSLSNYFSDFVKGVIDSRGIVFYLSVSVFFLYLATACVEIERSK